MERRAYNTAVEALQSVHWILGVTQKLFEDLFNAEADEEKGQLLIRIVERIEGMRHTLASLWGELGDKRKWDPPTQRTQTKAERLMSKTHRKGTKHNPFSEGDRVLVGPWGRSGTVTRLVYPSKPRESLKYEVELDEYLPRKGKVVVFSCAQVEELVEERK